MIEEGSSRNSAFAMMVKSFMNAYTGALGTLEYDELARLAILQLNRKIKKQVNVSNLFDSRIDMLNLY